MVIKESQLFFYLLLITNSSANHEAALKTGEYSDIYGKELYMELKFLKDFIPREEMVPVAVMTFVADGLFSKPPH